MQTHLMRQGTNSRKNIILCYQLYNKRNLKQEIKVIFKNERKKENKWKRELAETSNDSKIFENQTIDLSQTLFY